MKRKRCPRCDGMISSETDRDGTYLHCLICGWLRDLTPRASLPPPNGRRPQLVNAEQMSTPDHGCSVSPSCFECPLPDCQYSVPSARDAFLRDQAVLAIFLQHQHRGTKVAAEMTAKAVGTSDRSVYRTLARQKNTI